MAQNFPRDIEILKRVFEQTEARPKDIASELEGPETYVRRRLEILVDRGLLERGSETAETIRYEVTPPGENALEARSVFSVEGSHEP